jgi:hypothetical protein
MAGALTVAAPPSVAETASGNDEIAGATVIGSLPAGITQDITGATASPQDPARCWNGVTTWYTLTAPSAGTIRFVGMGRYAHDEYAHTSSALAIYAGSPDALTDVGCDVYDDDRGFVSPHAEVSVRAGQRLYVMVGDVSKTVGVLLTVHAAYVNAPPQVMVKTGMHFKPGTTLSHGGSTPTFQAQIKWTAVDADGVCAQRVVVDRHDADGNFYSRSTYNPAATARMLTTRARAGDYVYASVSASDCAGSDEGVGEGRFTPRLHQENALTYSAGWRSGSCSCWSGGGVMKVTRTGAKATYRFTGSSIGIVMPKAANRGAVHVYLDGVKTRTISLYAAGSVDRSVVWETAFATSAVHTLKLVSTGTKQVDVDALLIN